jgi:hypothetical protein
MFSLKAAVPLSLVLGLMALFALSTASAHAAAPVAKAKAAQDDDEVILPGRVANAIRRTTNSLNNAEQHIDENEFPQAVTSLRAARKNMYRADKAARHQMNAVVDPEAEDESTAGPDSVIAVLALDTAVVQQASALFDTNSKSVVDALSPTLYRTMGSRDRLLDSVIALDPEGAGADYSDGMADTVDGYTDEAASIAEALSDDTLSAGGRRVLQPALSKSQLTAAKVTLAFGGGE